jgi:murein DD-endopeptidase MepM/ murein hydrolase activator NlpD
MSLVLLGLAAAGLLLALQLRGGASHMPQVVLAESPSDAELGRDDALSHSQLNLLGVPESYSLRTGQTLVGWLLDGVGLDAQEAHEVAGTVARYVDPRRLQVGSELAVYRDARQKPRQLLLPLPGRGELRLSHDRTWWPQFREYERRTKRHRLTGTVEGGFEAAVLAAGGPAMLAYEVADVLQWDLDFNRDLRVGDQFSVVYDAVWVNGRVREIETVEAVRYINRGESIEAFRFGDQGYYDHEGKPLRKQFLRSPLPYSRVTSRFTNRRFHPVLKTYRPHYGVDYGAPSGTPVRVTANGVVASAAWSKGGGKTVKVRHANGYVTAYLHLSGYASGVRAGSRVRQGEVIGFVGSTGLSTAPHLDYRVQHDGRWMDPLTLPNEPAEPLGDQQLREFLERRQNLQAALDQLSPLDEIPSIAS